MDQKINSWQLSYFFYTTSVVQHTRSARRLLFNNLANRKHDVPLRDFFHFFTSQVIQNTACHLAEKKSAFFPKWKFSLYKSQPLNLNKILFVGIFLWEHQDIVSPEGSPIWNMARRIFSFIYSLALFFCDKFLLLATLNYTWGWRRYCNNGQAIFLLKRDQNRCIIPLNARPPLWPWNNQNESKKDFQTPNWGLPFYVVLSPLQ